MKIPPPFLVSPRVSRRDFLTGTTAGLTAGLFLSSRSEANAQRRGGGPDARGLPPMQPPPADFPGTGKYLYVTNDRGRRVDVFNNTNGQHQLLWSFPFADPGGRVGGICADSATQRIFFTQLSDQQLACYDMLTGKIIWKVNTAEKYG